MLTVFCTSHTNLPFSTFDSNSNWGNCVDIYAPGTSIRSSWAGRYADMEKTLSGTSASTPFVSGVVALYMEQDPMADPASLRERLIQDALVGILQYPTDGINDSNSTENDFVTDSSTIATPNLLLNVQGLIGSPTPSLSPFGIPSPSNKPSTISPHSSAPLHDPSRTPSNEPTRIPSLTYTVDPSLRHLPLSIRPSSGPSSSSAISKPTEFPTIPSVVPPFIVDVPYSTIPSGNTDHPSAHSMDTNLISSTTPSSQNIRTTTSNAPPNSVSSFSVVTTAKWQNCRMSQRNTSLFIFLIWTTITISYVVV